MIEKIDLTIHPDHIEDTAFVQKKLRSKLPKGVDVSAFKLSKKSIDARFKRVVYRLVFKRTSRREDDLVLYNKVSGKKKVIIVGAGPAGYFAALRSIELGLQPIVLDRGKDVRARRRDLRSIQQFGEVNPHSNYCFGEGGAGTYSDGKLYTRSHKRGNIQSILTCLYDHGASSNILTDAHPHIGSNKLPKIIAAIRSTIESCGGQVLFDHFVTDIQIDKNRVVGVELANGEELKCNQVILATGHSARDIFYLLHKKSIQIEVKDFALGVRIEHPQPLIDEIQYGMRPRHENLPAAPYRVAAQVEGRGVFSFCNCPGGLIVPAATAPGEIVVNGMSLSKRDSPFANSGFVTEVKMEEIAKYGYEGVFAALDFQKHIEQLLFNHGDGSQKAPGQLVPDFVHRKHSSGLNKSSYIPGVYSAPLHELLPNFIYERLARGIKLIDKKLRGFYTSEAQVVATESRTSSPIKIPRDRDTFMHPQIEGLFPCGEGAGYAGGILSAAMDGQNVASAVGRYVER